MAEQLSQDEIDRLTESFLKGETDDLTNSALVMSSGYSAIAEAYSTEIKNALKRFHRVIAETPDQDTYRKERHALHQAAFQNWLLKHNLDRRSYKELVNRQAKLKGYTWRLK